MIKIIKLIQCSSGVALVWFLIFSLILNPSMSAIAQVQSQSEQCLKEAETKYYDGQFDTAIEQLRGCLALKDITEQEQARAHELFAKSYLGKDSIDLAKSSIRDLLSINSEYMPDTTRETGPYVELVQKVKEEIAKEKPWYLNTWVLIGAGALVAGGVLIAILVDGKDNEQSPPSYWP